MEKLLAMVLTAFDSRRNPAAGLLWRTASHAFDCVAGLAGALLDEKPSASSCPPKSVSSCEFYGENEPLFALTPSGKRIAVHPVISL
jgi:hypothetical protein